MCELPCVAFLLTKTDWFFRYIVKKYGSCVQFRTLNIFSGFCAGSMWQTSDYERFYLLFITNVNHTSESYTFGFLYNNIIIIDKAKFYNIILRYSFNLSLIKILSTGKLVCLSSYNLLYLKTCTVRKYNNLNITHFKYILWNRKHIVCIGNGRSETEPVKCGVSQGFVLYLYCLFWWWIIIFLDL